MDEVVQSLAAAIEESSAVVTYADLPAICAHRPQMLQILQNLVGNAIKFAAPVRRGLRCRPSEPERIGCSA
jgi:light-regulated signal transduction histidine kinase (bacteriophytochrome)